MKVEAKAAADRHTAAEQFDGAHVAALLCDAEPVSESRKTNEQDIFAEQDVQGGRCVLPGEDQTGQGHHESVHIEATQAGRVEGVAQESGAAVVLSDERLSTRDLRKSAHFLQKIK